MRLGLGLRDRPDPLERDCHPWLRVRSETARPIPGAAKGRAPTTAWEDFVGLGHRRPSIGRLDPVSPPGRRHAEQCVKNPSSRPGSHVVMTHSRDQRAPFRRLWPTNRAPTAGPDESPIHSLRAITGLHWLMRVTSATNDHTVSGAAAIFLVTSSRIAVIVNTPVRPRRRRVAGTARVRAARPPTPSPPLPPFKYDRPVAGYLETADHAENGDRSIAIFPFVPLTTVGDVRLFDLGGDDNRFSDAVVSDLNELLTELEAGEGPRALVIRASGKVWSNGLDVPTVAGSETVR